MVFHLQKSLVKSKYIIDNKIKKSTSFRIGSKVWSGTITGNFFLPAADPLGSSSPRFSPSYSSSSSLPLFVEQAGVGVMVVFAPKFNTYKV